MLRKPFELAVIGTLIVCIIGHAGIGVVSAGDRVANADRTPNVVVSHQNTLHATFSDINSQLSALTGNVTFSPNDAVALVDQSVASADDRQVQLGDCRGDRLDERRPSASANHTSCAARTSTSSTRAGAPSFETAIHAAARMTMTTPLCTQSLTNRPRSSRPAARRNLTRAPAA